jgi:hypothetical protein
MPRKTFFIQQNPGFKRQNTGDNSMAAAQPFGPPERVFI